MLATGGVGNRQKYEMWGVQPAGTPPWEPLGHVRLDRGLSTVYFKHLNFALTQIGRPIGLNDSIDHPKFPFAASPLTVGLLSGQTPFWEPFP